MFLLKFYKQLYNIILINARNPKFNNMFLQSKNKIIIILFTVILLTVIYFLNSNGKHKNITFYFVT